ncbi:WD40 repeat-containing protein, putative [Bodo saltans]|uniref:WD40 repeat-containing protein, putative n=1 Tax=Bodo saltans TaxID=75058 RepID=A0A0S4JL93_BODSA|nr:WD40 repeat-containing protein, putative [Bodo saltans]|eukprot:CUG89836.1 WD40 repeat-containing protein, putative [Bodo saltans]
MSNASGSQYGYSASSNQPVSQQRLASRDASAATEGGGGALPIAPRGSVMELEHSIGSSGLPSTVHVLPGTSKYLATCGGCLVQGDLRDVHSQAFLRGHDNAITKLSISDDGSIAATGQFGSHADVCLWRVASLSGADGSNPTSALIRRISDHENSVLALAMSADSSIVASIGGERRLVFIDVSNGGLITHTPLNGVVAENDQFQGVYFGPRVQDHKRRNTAATHVAVLSSTKLLLFYLDPFSGQLIPRPVNVTSFQRRFTVGRFSTNGDFFFLGSEAGDVAVIETNTGSVSSTVRVCSGGVRDILVSGSLHNNDALDSGAAQTGGDSDNNFRYAKFGPGSERRTTFFVAEYRPRRALPRTPLPQQTRSTVLSVMQGPTAQQGAVLLAGCASGSLFVVDMSNAAANFPNAYTQVPSSSGMTCVADSVPGKFTVVTPHPSDPERFYTASTDGFLRSWDLSSYRQQQIFPHDGKTATGLSCSAICIADGLELMLSAWSDGAVRCHDLTNTKLLWTHARAHRRAVTALALSPSLKYFVSGSDEGEIRICDIRSREVKLELKDHTQAIVHLQLFDDDRHLLSASKDRMISTWDLTTGRRVTSHEAHHGPISSAFLSRNQTEVYSVGNDHRIHVHDIRHREAVRAAAYCPPQSEAVATKLRRSVDERLLVTSGTDQVVKLWEPRTLSVVTTGYAHSGTVTDVGFTCDNRQVLSCGDEGAVMVWNVYA